MTNDDQILFRALSKGDKGAYTSIFRRYYASLLMYARRYVVDHDVAEDIIQDLFCALWLNREKLPDMAAPRFYLYRAARNRSINWLRTKKAQPLEGKEFTAGDDIVADIIEEEVIRKLYEAIELLPVKCREVMVSKLSGMENDEIAFKLGITEETVRSQLLRGRRLLGKYMAAVMLFFLNG